MSNLYTCQCGAKFNGVSGAVGSRHECDCGAVSIHILEGNMPKVLNEVQNEWHAQSIDLEHKTVPVQGKRQSKRSKHVVLTIWRKAEHLVVPCPLCQHHGLQVPGCCGNEHVWAMTCPHCNAVYTAIAEDQPSFVMLEKLTGLSWEASLLDAELWEESLLAISNGYLFVQLEKEQRFPDLWKVETV